MAVLGPLEIAFDDTAVALPSRVERAVVAALAVRVGRPVAREAIAADVWGEDLAPGWRQNLSVTVSRLRRRLGATAGDQGRTLVRTVPDGYELALEPDRVDAVRFERLIGEGRQLLADGSPAAADVLLVEALGLWRGGPLPELSDSSVREAESARLGELRQIAIDDWHEATMALGDHDAVIGRLEAGLSEAPLRERRWAQLMLALYRSGRQSEALRAFQRARTVLGDQLGLEPGPELLRMEVAILGHDPALDLPAAGSGGRGPERPGGGGRSGGRGPERPGGGAAGSGGRGPERPGGGAAGSGGRGDDRASTPAGERLGGSLEWVDREVETPLVGRRDERERILRHWERLCAAHNGGVVFIDGDAGVGKTRLAAEIVSVLAGRGAHVFAGRCAPDGGLSALVPATAATGLARPEGDLRPGSPAVYEFGLEVTKHLVSESADWPTLVVLDDAQWADAQMISLFRQLSDKPLPLREPSTVLALVLIQRGVEAPQGMAELVRNLDRLDVSEWMTLEALGDDEARELFVDRVGPERPGRSAAVPLVDAVVRDAGGNARYLVAYAQQVRRAGPPSPEATADVVAGRSSAVDALGVPETIRAALAERLRAVSPELVRLLSTASVIGSGFDLAHLATAVGDGDEDAVLAGLEDAMMSRFVDEFPDAPGTYRFVNEVERRVLLDQLSSTRRARVRARLGRRP